jgi:hypothetical protein
VRTQIQFLNNAGFNWNLRADAIDFLYEGTAALSANDLLSNIKQTIQSPLAYNFMRVQVRRCCQHTTNLGPLLSHACFRFPTSTSPTLPSCRPTTPPTRRRSRFDQNKISVVTLRNANVTFRN